MLYLTGAGGPLQQYQLNPANANFSHVSQSSHTFPWPGATSSVSASSASSAPHPRFSSLQQLLALKNHVLMDLQRHGFGAIAHVQQRDARLTLTTGLFRAVVSPLSELSIFEVDCPAVTAGVRSTDWFMEAQPGSMRVGVLAGRVVMTSLVTGRRVTIPSRWGAHLEAGLDPVPARLWSSDEFADVIARTDVR